MVKRGGRGPCNALLGLLLASSCHFLALLEQGRAMTGAYSGRIGTMKFEACKEVQGSFVP